MARESYSARRGQQVAEPGRPRIRWPRSPRPHLPPAERHLDVMRLLGRSPRTIACRRSALARLDRQLPVPLLEASAEDLAAWHAALTLTPGTVAGYVSHAVQFFAWAAAEGLRPDNPAEDLPVPKLGRRLPRPIGEADLAAAVTGAPRRIRPWLVLAGWAGLRAKEIAFLRRENVLEAARQPALLIAHDATKGIRERIVPLCDYALGELLAAGLPRTGWVFVRQDGIYGPNQPWTVSRLASRYLHESGIPATLHQLRHRFGTQTYQASHDLRAVQELMGHAEVRSTAGYVAYFNASAIAAVRALPVPPEALPGQPQPIQKIS